MRIRSRKAMLQLLLKLLIGFILLCNVYPFFWMLISSFKMNSEFSKSMFALPESIYWGNYVKAYEYSNILVLFNNTAFVTIISVVFLWLFSATAGFALTKMRWKLSGLVHTYIQIGMFIPAFVLLLPQFLMFRNIHVLNTLWAPIIVFSSSISMSVYLITGFYRYLPDEVLEASVIDGCNIYQSFLHVVMPMSINGYVTVIMIAFVSIWNDLLISQTFVSSNKMQMLQSGLASFLDAKGARDWGATFAAICISVLPTLLVYLLLNQKIIDGLSSGAVKG